MSLDTARQALLAAAAAYIASEKHLEHSSPGPNDDAEMEYKDDALEDAALKYLVAKEAEG